MKKIQNFNDSWYKLINKFINHSINKQLKHSDNQSKIMNNLLLTIVIICMALVPTLQIEIPGIQLSSDTVVGNILYEPWSYMSLAVMLLVLLMIAWCRIFVCILTHSVANDFL